ncbi:unnamed protein product [Lupinus luteus]|uniref:Reverse transcriptase zinc-binding domain-containing protein n=1 Tax=Lupinus luteus TaxID=3873 RepID=A0AAV1VRI7_LUPLU
MRCLVWRIFLDGVSTKFSLARRGILINQDPLQYVLCGVMDEATNNLFLSCSKFYCVW